MTSSELLNITQPEQLFTGDPDIAQKEYRALVRRWHPDRADGDTAIFRHIHGLYREGMTRLSEGRWRGTADVTIKGIKSTRTVHTRTSSPFSLGHTVISDDAVFYLVEDVYRPLFESAVRMPKLFTYPSTRIREECERYLPKILGTDLVEPNRLMLHVAKTPDLIRLSDVVAYFGGSLDARHVTWIVSSLLNLACYFSYAGIVHHDISPDTYFISPKFHSGALLGGWWHATPRWQRVDAVPRRTHNVMPFKAKIDKRASSMTNLELIRLTGREILGTQTAPAAVRQWLNNVGSKPAVEQYREWMGIISPRRFTPMDINADAVYSKKAGH